MKSAAGRSSLIRQGAYRMGWIIEGPVEEIAGLVTEIVGESLSRVWLGSDRRIYRNQMKDVGHEPTSVDAHNIYALFDRVGFIPNP
ncbi:MAG: hypothetical protein M3O28_05400 [Actinomycetota bacterium]|nr:hypothetical protein [Actinomycetota bacterium]